MNVFINDDGPKWLPGLAIMPRVHPFNHAFDARHADDDEMATMQSMYQSKGGLVSGEAVAFLLRDSVDQPLSKLARWIVTRAVVSFASQSQTLLPLFQFDLSTMSLRAGIAEVTRMLSPVFDDTELAKWFVRPNQRLHGAMPLDAITRDQPFVLEAARADKVCIAAS